MNFHFIIQKNTIQIQRQKKLPFQFFYNQNINNNINQRYKLLSKETLFMTDVLMIFSLVARGKQTILASHTGSKGNFQQVATQVLRKCNLGKTFGQYGTADYNFYNFVKQGFIFFVMVRSTYETRVAVSFLKKIQQQFFVRYDSRTRNTAVSHSLKDFNTVLKNTMADYNNPTKIDKFSTLKSQLSQLEQQALKNMDKVIQRGQKIQILVKKSQTLQDQSYDMKNTAKTVRRKMWWKNKKILIAVIVVALALLGLIIALIV